MDSGFLFLIKFIFSVLVLHYGVPNLTFGLISILRCLLVVDCGMFYYYINTRLSYLTSISLDWFLILYRLFPYKLSSLSSLLNLQEEELDLSLPFLKSSPLKILVMRFISAVVRICFKLFNCWLCKSYRFCKMSWPPFLVLKKSLKVGPEF